jgi:iron(III) transport system ATP-binding protein
MSTRPIPAIEVCGVGKRFGAVTALDNVSFSIEAGEMFFLLGPSGCGKTTLLRILAGLETADGGTIRFDGKDIAMLPAHERGAPMVFQNYALWPHLNVRDNVAFGLVERRVAKNEIGRRVDDVLRRVELGGLGARMPNQLSGGQQQRVVLARALVLNPAIILLDEPLSNLDAKLRVEMRAEIEKLQAETDITFVYVTHDQADALSLADRMAVMSAGKVSAVGTPLDLYYRPPNVFCAGFLGEANLVEGEWGGVRGQGAGGETAETQGAGECEVETALGRWRGTVGDSGAKAGGVTCLIRPENLQPVDGPAAASNTFEAEIKGLRMNGPTVTVTLAAARGHTLKSTVLTQNSLGLRKGLRRWWGVARENTVVLAKDQAVR